MIGRWAGQELRRRRLANGLSQYDVPMAVGRTVFTISNWERGVNPPPADALPLLAMTFGCASIDDLFEVPPSSEGGLNLPEGGRDDSLSRAGANTGTS